MTTGYRIATLSLLMALSTAAAAQGPDPMAAGPEERAIVPISTFAGGIQAWQADGRDAVLLQGGDGQWHRASFLSPCINLPFATTISLVTDGSARLDSVSSLLVRNDQCWFGAIETTDAPDPG